MAVLIEMTWKLHNARTPEPASDRQEDGFNPSRIVKAEPAIGGPDGTDSDIRSRVLYNQGAPSVDEYYTIHEASDVVALANA